MRTRTGVLLAAVLMLTTWAGAIVEEDVSLDYGPKSLSAADLEGEKTVSIWDRAPTLEALAKQAGATATWDGRNLLWVKAGKDGEVEAFAVDQTYQYVGKGGKVECVTLKVTAETAPFVDFTELQYARRRAAVTADAEAKRETNWPRRSWARKLLTDPAKGDVYEIAWASLPESGSGAWEHERRVFVQKDAKGTWKVIGECEGGSNGRFSASDYLFTTLRAKASWTGKGDGVKVDVAVERRKCMPTADEKLRPVLTTLRRGSVQTGVSQAVWAQQEYMVTAEGDTVEKLAMRLARWMSSDMIEPEGGPIKGLAKAAQMWADEIRRVNPKLAVEKDGTIAAGTEVVVPDADIVEKRMTAKK